MFEMNCLLNYYIMVSLYCGNEIDKIYLFIEVVKVNDFEKVKELLD